MSSVFLHHIYLLAISIKETIFGVLSFPGILGYIFRYNLIDVVRFSHVLFSFSCLLSSFFSFFIYDSLVPFSVFISFSSFSSSILSVQLYFVFFLVIPSSFIHFLSLPSLLERPDPLLPFLESFITCIPVLSIAQCNP